MILLLVVATPVTASDVAPKPTAGKASVATPAATGDSVPTPAADDTAPTPVVGDEAKGALIHLMRENRAKYGDDATVLQGMLMMSAVAAEAVLATESAIRGFEEREGHRFVTFRLASGVVFNDRTHDARERLRKVWTGILERTFASYKTFKVPADGIAVEIEYSHRPYADMSELYQTIDDAGAKEQAKFYLLSSDLNQFLTNEVRAHELLGRSRVFVDGQPAAIDLTAAATPTPE